MKEKFKYRSATMHNGTLPTDKDRENRLLPPHAPPKMHLKLTDEELTKARDQFNNEPSSQIFLMPRTVEYLTRRINLGFPVEGAQHELNQIFSELVQQGWRLHSTIQVNRSEGLMIFERNST